jgi:hypothetical protein
MILMGGHRTRHFDIGEDHGDVAPGLKQKDGLVGIRGLQNFEPGFLDHVDRGYTDQGFVFDDEDYFVLTVRPPRSEPSFPLGVPMRRSLFLRPRVDETPMADFVPCGV